LLQVTHNIVPLQISQAYTRPSLTCLKHAEDFSAQEPDSDVPFNKSAPNDSTGPSDVVAINEIAMLMVFLFQLAIFAVLLL